MGRVLMERGRLVAVVCAVALFGSAASASAFTTVPVVWSGQATDNANWSNNANWVGGAHPTGGALDFPSLGSCSAPHVCYSNFNDLPAGTSFSGIDVDDGSPYAIGSNNGTLGNSIMLDAGGIKAAADTQSLGNMVPFQLNIALTADQVWNVDGGNSSQGITLGGQLSGAHTLGIDLANGGTLLTSQDQEIGNVTIQGGNSSDTGQDAVNNGIVSLGHSGQLNGTNGNAVTLTDAALGAGDATIGKFTSNGGNLQVGNGRPQPGILNVAGNVMLDANTVTDFTLGGGTTPGTDYGQLAATGNVTLDGSLELLVEQGAGGCATLNIGDSYTLVFTSALLNMFTFSNAPDGALINTPAGACPQSRLKISYSFGSTGSVRAMVVDHVPHSTSPPTISGNLTVGQTLTVNHGGWSSDGGSAPSSYHHQWKRCDGAGNNCTNVGTDSSNYTLQGGDAGRTIRVVETAVNAVGPSQPAMSGPSGVVQAPSPLAPPANQTAPVVTGATVVGDTMSTSAGTWTGSPPMSFAYRWQRCAATCSDISGATGSSYTLTDADLGMRVRTVVSATNSGGGPVSASSVQVGPVTASAAEIQSLLHGELIPHGKADSITKILNGGGAVISQTALEAGVEQVSWYYPPAGVHIAGHRKPVLIARGRVFFAGEGRARLKLKLTRAGRRMLRHHRKHLKLTAKGTFTPTGASGVSAKRNFKLNR